MPDTRTVAQRARGIRQDALREWLANQGLHSQAVELIGKIPDAADALALAKLDKQITHLLKLSNKYIPDLKSVEIDATVNDLRDARELSDAQLAHIASGSGNGTAEAQSSAEEPPSFH